MDFATSTHPGVQAQLDRISPSTSGFDVLGLDRIHDLLDRLGRPQDRLPPVLHVAGTNGKGSTLAFLRAALEAAGHSVHAFTSPHLVRFNERIRVAGKLIDDAMLEALLTEVIGAAAGIEASFFEVAAAAAILAFARTPADACILEVGLGGRLDATNVIDRPLVTGIASIGLDHQYYLGSTLVEIASEKAAIAKRGVPLITQHYAPTIARRVAQVAEQHGAIWLPRGGEWDFGLPNAQLDYRDARGKLRLPLPQLRGVHQAANAALAVAMLRHQDKLDIPDAAFAQAMELANWPARLQRLSPGPLAASREVWLDGGHNPAAARQIAAWAKSRFTDDQPLHLIFASLATKDPAGMLKPFAQIATRAHMVAIPGHASFAPNDLVDIAARIAIPAYAHDSVAGALTAIPTNARVLIFGSLYLAGTVLAANEQLPD